MPRAYHHKNQNQHQKTREKENQQTSANGTSWEDKFVGLWSWLCAEKHNRMIMEEPHPIPSNKKNKKGRKRWRSPKKRSPDGNIESTSTSGNPPPNRWGKGRSNHSQRSNKGGLQKQHKVWWFSLPHWLQWSFQDATACIWRHISLDGIHPGREAEKR